MIRMVLHSLQSEWRKTRRSLAAWLVIVGSLFTPAIVVVARFVRREHLPELYATADFWPRLWSNSWESMAIFFLPMAAILITTLLTQLEYRNNTWKLVHVLPLSLGTIFWTKLAVILLLLIQFLVLFNVGIYLSGAIPAWLLTGVPYPPVPIPVRDFLTQDVGFFVACLPIVALQYLISLRFSSFLVAVGVGFMTWVGALAALPWKFNYLIPYTYCMIGYLRDKPDGKVALSQVNLPALAIGYFIVFTLAGYTLFVRKEQKG